LFIVSGCTIIYKTYHFVNTPMVVSKGRANDLILKSIEKTGLFLSLNIGTFFATNQYRRIL